LSINEDKLIDAIAGTIAIAVIGFLVFKGLIPPDEGVRYILVIIGYILGRQGIEATYSSFRVRGK
jgi:hypothetical protein